MLNLDLDVLRSFVTGHDLGSFARAAERLGRSTSAVSAQLKKLEDQVGTEVLRKSGRGLVLTPAGEIVLSYARRLLELNDAAVMAVRGAQLGGSVRIGFQEDFGERVLTEVLGAFARTHPAVTVDARIARNLELERGISEGRLDLALAWHVGPRLQGQEILGRMAMRWIGDSELVAECAKSGRPLPLVAFESPCAMRSSALDALNAKGIPWRIAFTSTSLSGIWAAVGAGLGVTVRTAAGKPTSLPFITGLPVLPEIDVSLNLAHVESSPLLEQMASVVRARVRQILDS